MPALLLIPVLAACGDEKASDDPETTPSVTVTSPSGGMTDEQPGDSGSGAVDFELVDTITVTDAGGAVLPAAIPLTDDAAVAGFTAQFENDGMVAQIQDAVAAADVPAGQALYGAVIAIGCDSPTEVTVTSPGPGQLVIAPVKVADPQQECFAPMTTVALVTAAA